MDGAETSRAVFVESSPALRDKFRCHCRKLSTCSDSTCLTACSSATWQTAAAGSCLGDNQSLISGCSLTDTGEGGEDCSLPASVIFQIATFLTPVDVCHMSETCQRWRRICHSNFQPLWRDFVGRYFGRKYENYVAFTDEHDWRQLFIKIAAFISNLRRGKAEVHCFRSLLEPPECDSYEGCLAMTTDCSRLLWENGRILQCVDVNQGKEVWRVAIDDRRDVSPRPSVVIGKTKVFLHIEQQVRVYELQDGTFVNVLSIPPEKSKGVRRPFAGEGRDGQENPTLPTPRQVQPQDEGGEEDEEENPASNMPLDVSLRNMHFTFLTKRTLYVFHSETLDFLYKIRHRELTPIVDTIDDIDFCWAGNRCCNGPEGGECHECCHSGTRFRSRCQQSCKHIVTWLVRKSQSIQIWDVRDGSHVCSLQGYGGAPIQKVRHAMNWNDTREYFLASLDAEGTVRIWASSPGMFYCLQELKPEYRTTVFRMSFSATHLMTMCKETVTSDVKITVWRFDQAAAVDMLKKNDFPIETFRVSLKPQEDRYHAHLHHHYHPYHHPWRGGEGEAEGSRSGMFLEEAFLPGDFTTRSHHQEHGRSSPIVSTRTGSEDHRSIRIPSSSLQSSRDLLCHRLGNRQISTEPKLSSENATISETSREVLRRKDSSLSSFSEERESEKCSPEFSDRIQRSRGNGSFSSPLVVEQDFDDVADYRRRSLARDRHATPAALHHPARLSCSSNSSTGSIGRQHQQQRLAIDPNDPYPHVKRSYLYTRGSTDSSNFTRTSSSLSQDENAPAPVARPFPEFYSSQSQVSSEKTTPDKQRRLNSITDMASGGVSQRVMMSAPRGYDDGCSCAFCYCGSSNRCLLQRSQSGNNGRLLGSPSDYRCSRRPPRRGARETATHYRVIPLSQDPIWPAAVNFSRGVPPEVSLDSGDMLSYQGSEGDYGRSTNGLSSRDSRSSSLGGQGTGGVVFGGGREFSSQQTRPESNLHVNHDPHNRLPSSRTANSVYMLPRHPDRQQFTVPTSPSSCLLPSNNDRTSVSLAATAAAGMPSLSSTTNFRPPLLEKQLSFAAGGTAYYADFIDGHLLAVWYFSAGPGSGGGGGGGGSAVDSRGRFTALQYSLSNWKVFDCIKHETDVESRGCFPFLLDGDTVKGEKSEGDESTTHGSSLHVSLGRQQQGFGLREGGGGVTQAFSASHNALLQHYGHHDRPRRELLCRSQELSSVFPVNGGACAGGGGGGASLGRAFSLASFPVQRSPGPPVFSMQDRGDVWTLLDWKCISLHPRGDLTVYNFCPSSVSSLSSSVSLVDKRDF